MTANLFGEMTPMDTNGRAAAALIGANFYRNITAIYAEDGTPPVSAALDTAQTDGYDLIITIRGHRDASAFTDMTAYASYITAVISKWSPWGIVIENEENLAAMYAGTTTQYNTQLATAYSTASPLGVKVMNGGLSSEATKLLIWQNVYGGYPNAAAEAYAYEAFDEADADVLASGPLSAPYQAIVDRTEAFYNSYSGSSNIDYANFHFYVVSTVQGASNTTYDESVDFMRLLGKPLFSNEWGLRVDSVPVLLDMMSRIHFERIAGSAYFSPAPASGYNVIELQNDDGSLTSLGTAFKNQLEFPNFPYAFGEQNPTQNEEPVSWQTWSKGVTGTVVTVVGDPDWGKLKLDLAGEEGRSDVYDFGSAHSRKFTITENRYGTGAESAIIEMRGATGTFAQNDVLPDWDIYSGSFTKVHRYVQVRVRTP